MLNVGINIERLHNKIYFLFIDQTTMILEIKYFKNNVLVKGFSCQNKKPLFLNVIEMEFIKR